MTETAYKYTALISSLPGFGPLFKAQQTPLSRIQLEQRLNMLDPEDYACLEKLGQLLDWFQHPLEQSDAEMLKHVNDVLPQIDNEFIRREIEWRLSLRTLVAALRRKQLGLVLPVGERWGYGPWVSQIQRHWQEPAFGLEKRLPWLTKVNDLLKQDQAAELEKFLLELVWEHLEKVSFGHEFDLEAVAAYRLRWDLVARWTCYAMEPARQRFNELVQQALAPVTNEIAG